MRDFRDRRDAGRQLAQALARYAGRSDVVVLALPRGGVPVAYEIAARLSAPMDVLVVRKVGVPGHAELAMGAIASGGVRVVDQRVMRSLNISPEQFEAVAKRELAELDRRERTFRGQRPPMDVRGKTVIVVDDGLATGSTMTAAIDTVRSRAPQRLIGAVPVAPPETCEMLRARADEMVCLMTPDELYAVGLWYQDFSQTTDDEVRELLDAARTLRARAAGPVGAEPAHTT